MVPLAAPLNTQYRLKISLVEKPFNHRQIIENHLISYTICSNVHVGNRRPNHFRFYKVGVFMFLKLSAFLEVGDKKTRL